MIRFPLQGRRGVSSSRHVPKPRRRSVRPSLEALEGRVVLNASPLDPSFGTGGLVTTSPTSASGTTYNDDAVVAVAVQSDGKIVETELLQTDFESTFNELLVVRRYNPNGTLDTTFGSSGSVNVPATVPYQYFFEVDHVIIGPDGSITLGYGVDATTSSGAGNQSYIVRLTSAGQLDPNFGTKGQVLLPGSLSSLADLAVQTDGKILAVGSAPVGQQPHVVRLTTTGAVDTSFNGTGEVALPEASVDTEGIATAPGGQIYVLTTTGSGTNGYCALTRINADGTIDTRYGSSGNQTVPGSYILNHIAVRTDGKVVLAGYKTSSSNYGQLIQLNADGSTDTTFAAITGSESTGIALRFDQFDSVAVGSDNKITVSGSVGVARFLPTGAPDLSFAANGLATFNASLGSTTFSISRLALTPSGTIILGGSYTASNRFQVGDLAAVQPTTLHIVTNDYDGDGKSDIAAELTRLGSFASRPSAGGNDVLQGFGPTGAGATIPAPGDYDGDGKTNVAAYLPGLGQMAYRSAISGQDTRVPLGTAGAGASIPAPGDYDGDGITDNAVYVPATGSFVIQESKGRPISYSGPGTITISTLPFGQTGVGNSIPAPGDYDGDGITDLAVYLPKLGALAYRPSSGGNDQIIPFGNVGAGASIPTPGDYDGDGKTDLSVYLPALGIYAYRPSSGGADVLQSYGQVGAGASIPAPGDYDGDGKTDIAVYIPSLAQFIDRPSSGGKDVVTVFGQVGSGATIPAGSIPYAQLSSGGGTSGRGTGTGTGTGASASLMAVYIPLIGDQSDPANPLARKKTTGTV